MNISPTLLISYFCALFALCVVCRIFIKPIKWGLKLLISCGIGCLAMYIVNMFCEIFAINPLTAMLSGVLGAPGMVLTLILQGIL